MRKTGFIGEKRMWIEGKNEAEISKKLDKRFPGREFEYYPYKDKPGRYLKSIQREREDEIIILDGM